MSLNQVFLRKMIIGLLCILTTNTLAGCTTREAVGAGIVGAVGLGVAAIAMLGGGQEIARGFGAGIPPH